MDYKEKKVFILENHEYKEITYSEFRERMEANDLSENDNTNGHRPFSERFFISIDDTLLEVSQEQYIDYYNLDKVKQNISREDFTVNRKIVMELVSQIKLISDEEIEITLINGQVLRKENPDGNNSTIE